MEEKITLSKLEFVNVLIAHPNIIKGVNQWKPNTYQYFINEVCGTKWKYKIPWELKSAELEKKKIWWHFKDLYKKYQMNLRQKSRGVPLNKGFSNENWICHENYPNLFPEKITIINKDRYLNFFKLYDSIRK